MSQSRRAASESALRAVPRRPAPGRLPAPRVGAVVVEELAGSALLQDLGRAHIASGVPVGGAFDRRAHRLAVALVGCPADQATVEIVGRIVLRAPTRALVAVTGSATVALRRADPGGSAQHPTEARGDGAWHPAPTWTALDVEGGQELRVVASGRAYLAVRGGLSAAPVLGSRSTCLLGPLGPPPIVAGQTLEIGQRIEDDARAGDFCRPLPRDRAYAVVPGPHAAWTRTVVEVVDVSRIGMRLAVRRPGAAWPERADLPSLGVLPGTIQALPNGDWMLLGPDAGTMGGYPVVGVLAGDGLDGWAHQQPGDVVELVASAGAGRPVSVLESIVRVGEIG